MAVVLITGATGGIGKIIAEALSPLGFELILLSRNKEELDKIRNSLGSKVKVIPANVEDFKSLEFALKKTKKIDILINCAGILGPVGIFEDNDMEEWYKTIQVNLLGTVNTCKILIPLLKKSRRGKIINFSGGGGASPRIYHSAYACSKAAVIRFTENLSIEYPNLDINVIAPGAHKTNIWKNETYDKEPEKWADPKRLQSLIIYLCSSDSKGLTGKFIHINDDWDKKDLRKVGPEEYTLRRIDSKIVEQVKKYHV